MQLKLSNVHDNNNQDDQTLGFIEVMNPQNKVDKERLNISKLIQIIFIIINLIEIKLVKTMYYIHIYQIKIDRINLIKIK